MLSFPSSVVNALASNDFTYSLLVDLPGNFQVTNNPHDLTWSSVTYSPAKLLMDVGDIERRQDISSDSFDIIMDNADQAIYQDYVANNRIGTVVPVYAAFVDPTTYDLLAADSVVRVYSGLFDSWDVSEAGTKATVTLRLTSHWSAWKVVKGRATNSSSQEEVYPGDTIFEFSYQEELPHKWGL